MEPVSLNTNIDPKNSVGLAKSTAGSKGQTPPIDPLLLAYFCLVNAANTSCRTAEIKSKELQANGLTQMRLNQQLGQIGWYNPPSQQFTKVLKSQHTVWNFHWYAFPFFFLPTVIKTYTNVVKNGTAINAAQMKNQQADAERTQITQHLNLLQQDSQISESKVSTIVNTGVQDMQQASGFVDMLSALTFKVLMRQQPN